ncbi:mannose-1-phosphate guanylyltransferase [Paenibacillus castaneae]|uniref:sugar phosphate nucleotidyltransferase n=1 Tax=Paenibacillus castaneae TaxID=474957 RepID=UPI000C9A8CAC|nr:sugar phosphate nucleotidyltransferase [Paenibacillus castaneae]NIK76523.1 mannose-1-phosphate guanylyltransferase [Paenibacillus castaneae]
MRIILLSGGSGKRLWPLSNEIRSKIFLKLLPTGDNRRESMIQRVCRQLEQAGLLSSISIVTHHSQIELTQNHVGDQIPILGEPYKRGTFMAVGLAASYLYSKLQMDLDETICVIPVDLFVESDFYKLLRQLPEVLAQSCSNLALIGTVPNHPSTQYGYIVPKESGRKDYLNVSKFVEKPNEKIAASLISENALWNCGVFAFSLRFMLSCLTSKGLPVDYEQLIKRYELFPVTSFDEEVVEKTQQCVVVPYDKAWQDLGDWRILPNYLGNHVIGKGHISNDSFHSHIINELMYPIHVIGLSNIIVAASPDGIIVANKDESNQIKEIVKEWRTPMYEEKRWGRYQVIDYSTIETEIGTITRKVELLPGKNTSYHLHQNRSEYWTIISGSGEFILEGTKYSIQTGDVVQIPLGAKHAVKAISPLEYIEIQIGKNLLEDDKRRIAMTWEEIIKYCNVTG